ncbi:universal stress protein PHOS34-like [Musa acuminata AAA Group]|uniref:universal stress protein PHOS34-like n=1 Tax=Musa acuminata AAA Group TaxID=214697 RepID=UPI0031DB37FF
MGRSSTRLPSFCLNRMSPGVRVRSPPLEPKPPPSPESGQLHHHGNAKQPGDGAEEEALLGRRIMIVVDSSPESKTALRWALSHSVQSNDSIVLVDVVRPPKHGEQSGKERDPKIYELLHSMRSVCHARKPEVQVELSLVEATERGPAIVEEARKQDASLLIMGQKKRSLTWRLVMMWAGRKVGGSVADFCVQNATCMAMAVRRKSRRGGGGYLITTKRHKDFWLLA